MKMLSTHVLAVANLLDGGLIKSSGVGAEILDSILVAHTSVRTTAPWAPCVNLSGPAKMLCHMDTRLESDDVSARGDIVLPALQRWGSKHKRDPGQRREQPLTQKHPEATSNGSWNNGSKLQYGSLSIRRGRTVSLHLHFSVAERAEFI